MSPSWTRIVLASRKRVSRSPYQSKKPETAKRRANASVRIALSF